MISLFVLDIDGCISYPFVTPDWQSITKIREYNQLSRTDQTIPQLSICTGRPYPYAEAVAQWLDIRVPFAFESGGGIYYPEHQKVELLPAYHKHADAVAEMKTWADSLVNERFPDVLIEFTKKTDVGFIHTDEAVVRELFEIAKLKASGEDSLFEVHRTEVSVNVILKECNKGAGITRIAELVDVPLENVAYIGDSTGDLTALKVVGHPFCPANANAAVKSISRKMSGKTSKGVLEAYEIIIDKNRSNS